MKFPYMASDLDGTIVKNNDFLILEDTKKDILNYQIKSGNKFTIATGRNYQLVKKYVKELEVNLPIIAINGAAIINPLSDEVIDYTEIKKDKIIKLIDFFIENNCDVSIHTPLTIIGVKNNERFKSYYKYSEAWNEDDKPVLEEYNSLEDIKKLLLSGEKVALKVTASFDPNKTVIIERTHQFCEDNDLYHPDVVLQGRKLIDILDKNVNKAVGIKKLANILKVDCEDIVTFGDNNNDIEMTEQAKVGVAVGNAVKNLKDVAKHVTETIDNNGVGKFIRENY